METKTYRDIEVKTDAQGEFEARIVTFNKPDKAGDVFRPGSFAESIAEWRASDGQIPVVFAHQSTDPKMYVGQVDPAHVREDARGVVAKGRFYLDEENAHKIFKQLQRKALREWSFTFLPIERKALAHGAREFLKVDLREIGPCLIGCGDTQTIAVKAAPTVGDVAEARQRLVAVALAPHYQRLDLIARRVRLAGLR